MIAANTIAQARRAAQRVMIDTARVTRPSGEGSVDDGGNYVPADPVTVYEGPIRVKPAGAGEQEIVFGDVATSERRYIVDLPHYSTDIAVDDRVVVTDSNDPQMATAKFRVAALDVVSVHVRRRLGVEVIE